MPSGDGDKRPTVLGKSGAGTKGRGPGLTSGYTDPPAVAESAKTILGGREVDRTRTEPGWVGSGDECETSVLRLSGAPLCPHNGAFLGAVNGA